MLKRFILLLITIILIVSPGLPKTMAQERYNFLIVVADGLREIIEPLANHRTEQGLRVKIVEISEIKSDNRDTIEQKLWNYLRDNYEEWGLSHLLIVANSRDIPQARLHSANGVKVGGNNQAGLVYSDIYYSILNQDWDSNDNGLLGEPIDNVEIDPQLSIGRIPFSNKDIVSKWVEGNIGYDESAKRRHVLQIGAIYSFEKEDGDPTNLYTDGTTMHNIIWDELLSKNRFSRVRMFENDSKGIDKEIVTDETLSVSNVLTTLSENEFGMVNFLAHGETTSVKRKRWQRDINKNGWADNRTQTGESEILIETLFSADLISAIEVNCGVVIGTACSTAYVATSIDSIASSFLRSGASAYIGGSAMNYFFPGWGSREDGGNQTISYDITKYYTEGATLGWSLMSTLRDYYYNFNSFSSIDKTLQNVYSFILLGDPTMRLDPPKSVKQLPVFLKPPIVKITSGETATINVEIGNVNSTNPVILHVDGSVNGISFSFPQGTSLPGSIIKLTIDTSITVNPGDYEFIIVGEVEDYHGSATLRVKIVPPPESTIVQLQPEYTLVNKNHEFWLDFIVKPTKPIDSLALTLNYDSSCFEYVGYRLGAIITEDYRCPSSVNVDNRPGFSDLIFSFERGVDNYGITTQGVVVSFCFKSVCLSEVRGSRKFAVSSLHIESNKDDGRRTHSFASLPHSLVKVIDEQNSTDGYFINIDIPLELDYKSDLSTASNQLTITGKTTVGTTLSINSKLVPVDSEGKFIKTIDLNSRVTDIEFMMVDEFNRFLMIKRRVEISTITELGFHNGENSAWTNGACQTFDASPYITNGRTLVPIRFITVQLDFDISWNSEDRRVDISKNGTSIQMWIGNVNAKLNGNDYRLDAPPEITSDRTFVPLRFVSEALGCDVSWDNKTRTALVTYNVNENP